MHTLTLVARLFTISYSIHFLVPINGCSPMVSKLHLLRQMASLVALNGVVQPRRCHVQMLLPHSKMQVSEPQHGSFLRDARPTDWTTISTGSLRPSSIDLIFPSYYPTSVLGKGHVRSLILPLVRNVVHSLCLLHHNRCFCCITTLRRLPMHFLMAIAWMIIHVEPSLA
jgi:hypothetical protein